MKRSVVIGLFIVLLASGCSDRAFLFEVPDGYVGWVTVQFNKSGCADTRTLMRTTIRVRADGTACTAVARDPVTTFSEFYYVANGKRTKELKPTGWGEGGMIWAESAEIDGHEYRFFVGTEKQLSNAWGSRPRTSSFAPAGASSGNDPR